VHEIEVPVGPSKFVGPVSLQIVARERIQLGQAFGAETGDPGQKLDIGAVLGVIAAELGDDDVVQLDRERCDGLAAKYSRGPSWTQGSLVTTSSR
jgi:hypothetical protein